MSPVVHDATLCGLFATDDKHLKLFFRAEEGSFTISIPSVERIYGSDLVLRSIVFDLTFVQLGPDPEKAFGEVLSGLPQQVLEGVEDMIGRPNKGVTAAFRIDSSYGLCMVGFGSWRAEEIEWLTGAALEG